MTAERVRLRRLTGLEHAFVAYEVRSPVSSVQIGGLSTFIGQPPSLAELRRFVAAALGELPTLELALHRFRRRLWWARVSRIDLGWHVREWVAEPGGLHAAVDAIMARRLVRGAPPWQAWVLHGYAPGEWAILFKVHHALLDGASMCEVICRLIGRAPSQLSPPAEEQARGEARGRVRRRDLRTVARGALRYLAGFLPLASGSFTTGGRTGELRFAWTTVPLGRLRTAADRHDCTVNDVFLAALATALRDWAHTPWRRGPCPVWTLVPVDLHRRRGNHELGTKVVNLRVALPCDEPDPLRRLRSIARMTERAKGSGNVGAANAGERSMPGWFVRAVFAVTFSRWHVDLLASNVRGLRARLDYEGAPLTGVVPLGFLPRRHPLGAYVLTYHDQVGVCFAVGSSLPRGDELCRLWVRGLTELAGPVGGEPEGDWDRDTCPSSPDTR